MNAKETRRVRAEVCSPLRERYARPVVKKVLIIGLVVLIVVTGVPILMGGGSMASCRDCGPAISVSMTCVAAVLVGVALLIAAASGLIRRRDIALVSLLPRPVLDPPPRLA